MKRFRESCHTYFALSIVTIFLYCSHANSSDIRVAALGGESRFLDDTVNLFRYPASAVNLPHIEIALFDNWAGAAYPLSEKHAIGLFFNRPTSRTHELRKYAIETGSEHFTQLHPKPWIDALYARRLGKLNFGISGQHYRDIANGAGYRANISASDITFGIGLHNKRNARIEVGFGLHRTNLEDSVAGTSTRQTTEGTGWHTDIRATLPLSNSFSLFPIVSITSDAFALEPETREVSNWVAGVGLNSRPNQKVLAVVGVLIARNKTKSLSPDSGDNEILEWSLPILSAGAEVQVGSILFRLGIRNQNLVTESTTPTADSTENWRYMDVLFNANLGLGLEFGNVQIDGHLEQDFLRDGPHIIGGSRHGGGIFSAVSMTYQIRN